MQSCAFDGRRGMRTAVFISRGPPVPLHMHAQRVMHHMHEGVPPHCGICRCVMPQSELGPCACACMHDPCHRPSTGVVVQPNLFSCLPFVFVRPCTSQVLPLVVPADRHCLPACMHGTSKACAASALSVALLPSIMMATQNWLQPQAAAAGPGIRPTQCRAMWMPALLRPSTPTGPGCACPRRERLWPQT